MEKTLINLYFKSFRSTVLIKSIFLKLINLLSSLKLTFFRDRCRVVKVLICLRRLKVGVGHTYIQKDILEVSIYKMNILTIL